MPQEWGEWARVSSQFPSGYGDFYSFTPVTALAKPQQIFGTHLDQVGLPWSQLPQLDAGHLKWPNLLKKCQKYQHDCILGEYFMKGGWVRRLVILI